MKVTKASVRKQTWSVPRSIFCALVVAALMGSSDVASGTLITSSLNGTEFNDRFENQTLGQVPTTANIAPGPGAWLDKSNDGFSLKVTNSTSGGGPAQAEAVMRRHIAGKLLYDLPLLRERFGDGPIRFDAAGEAEEANNTDPASRMVPAGN